jgi:hypothetical protein
MVVSIGSRFEKRLPDSEADLLRTRKALSFAAALLLPLSLSAATFVVPPDRDLIRRADAIVIGSPLSSYSQLNALGGIETVTTISVSSTLRGVAWSTIDVVEPGGAYNDRYSIIAGVPQFSAGERLLLFLRRTGPNRWAVEELVLGKFRFATDTRGRELLVRDAGEITALDSQLRPYGEPVRAAAPFLRFVRNEAVGVHDLEDYFVTDPAPLRVQAQSVEANAAFSATSYTMVISGSMGSRWNVFPSAVTVFSGTPGEPGAPGGGVTAVQTALASWDNDCPSNVNYVYGGTDSTHTQGLHAADGVNTVLWEQDLSQWGIGPFTCSGNSYSGTLGIGGISSASGTNVVNGETFVTTQEGDVMMNKGLANCTVLFNNGDFNSAVTHELGHTLGFRHSDHRNSSGACGNDPSLECSASAIMKSFIPNGLNAALQAWDQHAVQAVYPGGSCGTGGPAPKRGDLSGDGISDIVWRNTSTGDNSVWFVNASGFTGGATLPFVPTSASIVGAGDFNHDGHVDLLWRNSSGGISVWFMNGGSLIGGVTLPSVSNTAVIVAGVGDLNGDGSADIVWRNTQNGDNSVWYITASGFTGGATLPAVANSNLFVASVADFNADGRADLLWRNSATGENFIWLMNGGAIIGGSQLPTIPNTLQLGGTGDFNGDGAFDLLWRNTITGDNSIWFIQNGAFNGGGITLPNVSPIAGVQIASVGDFNGNGTYDILWRNESSGADSVWFITAGGFAGGVNLPSVVSTVVKIVSPTPR